MTFYETETPVTILKCKWFETQLCHQIYKKTNVIRSQIDPHLRQNNEVKTTDSYVNLVLTKNKYFSPNAAPDLISQYVLCALPHRLSNHHINIFIKVILLSNIMCLI